MDPRRAAHEPPARRTPANNGLVEYGDDELEAIDALNTEVRGGPEPEVITMESFGHPIPED